MIVKTKRKTHFATPDERAELPKALLDWVDQFGSLEFSTDNGKVYLITKPTK